MIIKEKNVGSTGMSNVEMLHNILDMLNDIHYGEGERYIEDLFANIGVDIDISEAENYDDFLSLVSDNDLIKAYKYMTDEYIKSSVNEDDLLDNLKNNIEDFNGFIQYINESNKCAPTQLKQNVDMISKYLSNALDLIQYMQ